MFKAPYTATLIAAVAAAAVATTPAMAKSSSADEDSYRVTVRHQNGQKLYCLTETRRTGSHVRPDTCQTREDWARDGVTIPEAKQTVKKAENASEAG